MKLATALIGVGNGGAQVFRGIRSDSKIEGFQFWSTDRDYAEQYAHDEVLEAEVANDAAILDLRGCVNEDGDYDGALLEEALPGLADALGIDSETVIERDRLWDCCGGDYESAVQLVAAAGYQGWLWFEGDGNQEAFCLEVA